MGRAATIAARFKGWCVRAVKANTVHAATVLVGISVLLFGLALWAQLAHELTWERPVAYSAAVIALIFGLSSLFALMVRTPNLLTVGFFYEVLFLLLIYLAIAAFSLNTLAPWLPRIPEDLLFPLLLASIGATAFVNFGVLYVGRKLRILDDRVDPVPGRSLWRSWKQRRAANRRRP